MSQQSPFFRRIKRLCNVDYDDYAPVVINGVQAGWMRREMAKRLADLNILGTAASETELQINGPQVTQTLQTVIQRALAAGVFPNRDRFGDERFPVFVNGKAVGTVLRGYARFFGFETESVVVIGYTDDGLWLQRRGAGMAVSPGKLDVIAAGGCPAGVSYIDAARQELREEAGINAPLPLTHVETLRFHNEKPISHDHDLVALYAETYHVFQVQIPQDCTPTADGDEVDSFHHYTYAQLADMLEADDQDLKLNSSLVMMSYLWRGGYLTLDDGAAAAIKALQVQVSA